MFAQFCGRLADLGSPDQKLERAPESPASPSDNQIMNAPLGRCHLIECDLTIPGHLPS
jgi:hypothetical protein